MNVEPVISSGRSWFSFIFFEKAAICIIAVESGPPETARAIDLPSIYLFLFSNDNDSWRCIPFAKDWRIKKTKKEKEKELIFNARAGE